MNQPAASPAPASRVRPVTLPRVLNSEWVKFRTIRSTYVLVAVTLLILLAAWPLTSLGFSVNSERGGMQGAVGRMLNPTSIGLQIDVGLAQLIAGVIGVIFVTSEYSTGMIRATFAAVPARIPVLFAKALLLAIVMFVVTVPALLVAFFISRAILSSSNFEASLWDPGVVRALAGGGLYLAGIAVLGAVLGWLLRSAAGAIATFVGIIILLPTLLPIVPFEFIKTIRAYLPSTAGQQVLRLPGLFDEMTRVDMDPWTGFAILTGYAIAGIAAAAFVLRLRDA